MMPFTVYRHVRSPSPSYVVDITTGKVECCDHDEHFRI